MGARIALIGSAVVVLIIIMLVVLAIFRKPNPNTAQMISLAKTQQEVNRIATAGLQKTTMQGLRNSSINVELTLLSHQNRTIAYLDTQKVKVTLKQLALKKSAATDAQLKTATENSTYDIVYGQVLQTQLKNYSNELKNAYTAVTGTNAKKLLSAEFTDTQKLLAQLNTNLPTSDSSSN